MQEEQLEYAFVLLPIHSMVIMAFESAVLTTAFSNKSIVVIGNTPLDFLVLKGERFFLIPEVWRN